MTRHTQNSRAVPQTYLLEQEIPEKLGRRRSLAATGSAGAGLGPYDLNGLQAPSAMGWGPNVSCSGSSKMRRRLFICSACGCGADGPDVPIFHGRLHHLDLEDCVLYAISITLGAHQ